jgi:hypothetical protein
MSIEKVDEFVRMTLLSLTANARYYHYQLARVPDAAGALKGPDASRPQR